MAMNPSLRNRLPLYPSQFIAGFVVVSLGPLLDSMMRDLGIPLSRGGLISLAFFAGQVVGIVVLNLSMARIPAKQALILGALLQAVSLIVAGLVSRSLGSLLAAWWVAGLGWALFNTIGWMWVPVHIKQGTAAAILLMTLFYALGNMLGPLVTGSLLGSGTTWRWILAGEGMVTLALALAFAVLPFLDVPGRQNLRLSHARQVAGFNRGLLVSMLLVAFLYVGVETSLSVWLPKYQIDTFHASEGSASLAVTFFWAGVIVGRLLAVRASRRFSPARLVVLCGGGLALFSIGLALAPGVVASMILAVGAGLGASASFGLIGSYSSRFPAWHAGVVSSAYLLAAGVGSMVFPYLIGPVASAAGFRVAISLLAIPAALYALLALVVRARSGEASEVREIAGGGKGS
jgi:fucose permease